MQIFSDWVAAYFINVTKVRFFINSTNFSNHYNFSVILKKWYCWKAMAEWNTEVESILEKRKIKVEKIEDENFKLFSESSCDLQNLIIKISILSDQENICFLEFFFFVEKLNNKALFSLTIKFRIYVSFPGVLMFFSVNKLENNDTSGNKESDVLSYNI